MCSIHSPATTHEHTHSPFVSLASLSPLVFQWDLWKITGAYMFERGEAVRLIVLTEAKGKGLLKPVAQDLEARPPEYVLAKCQVLMW